MPETRTLISLQPGQPGCGTKYDPALPLPYPIVVGEDGRCENVPGYPFRGEAHRDELPILVGFQEGTTPAPETMTLADRWRENPDSAVGLAPVFFEPGGASDGMFNLAVLITSVEVTELAGR